MANVSTRASPTLQDRNGMTAVIMNVSVKMETPENTSVTTGKMRFG